MLAAVAVALVALPLSLAISNASGVAPEVGLVTAVVGGVVAALLGGCRLQVSGPAAAMTFLVLEVVTNHGMRGLIAATLMAGMIQVAGGGLPARPLHELHPPAGDRRVPVGHRPDDPLHAAPVILGYEVLHSNEEGGAVALLWKTLRQVGQTNPQSLAVGLTAMVLMIGLPRISRKLPTPLLAVGAASLLPWALGWSDVAMLGAIPSTFPAPDLPVDPLGRVERAGHGRPDDRPAGLDRVAAVGLGGRLDVQGVAGRQRPGAGRPGGWPTWRRPSSGASR